MSRPKNFNDYSYGVGLEYNASSYKQVKDAMKSNMDALLKMAKAYNEAIKIDPDVDMSKMVSAFKELATIINQTKQSGNPFSEFVDKGILNRVFNLEQNLGSLTKTSAELKKTVDSMFDGIKNVGKEKFSGSFDDIFGYKSKEIDDVTESIKKLNAEIDNLKKIPSATTGTFNRSTKEQKISKASVKEVEDWIKEYQKLADEVDSIDPSDFEKIGPALKRMRELGMSIKESLDLPNIQKSKGFSEYQSFLKESARFFERSVEDFNANVQEKIVDLRQQRKVLEDELIKTKESVSKLSGQAETTKGKTNKKGISSLGKLDQTVDVSVNPKVDVAVWSDTINKKLKLVQDKLEPVVLKATFSNKSKNLEKELDGNIAAINHTVKAEFNIEDNFGNENDPNSFFGKLRKLDTDLQEAKEKLSSKTQFKVRFAFESADGTVVNNVKSYVQNQFKNIPVTLHVKNGKSFMTSITNMINGVKGNFEKSLTDIPVSFKIKNEEELLKSVYALKETIGANMNDIGVNFVTNGIINIGDAADIATKEVEELSDSVEKINNSSKKKSPSLAELFEEYDKLEAKLNSVYGNKEKLIATYGKGEKGFSAYEKDVKKFQQLEKGLGTALEERSKAKELDRLSTSAVNAQKNIIKAKDALVDLNKNKFSSEFFIEIGYVQNGKSVGDPSGSLKKLVEEYDTLSKKISKESSTPGSIYPNNKSGRSQYSKDAARLTFLNKTLNDALQNQIQLLSRKENINKEILETTSKELSLQEKQEGSKADLAQNATKAEQKYAKLNETITKTEEILKDLSGNKSLFTNSDKTYQFTKLGEWDESTKKFKRNKEEMKKLLEEYRNLHKANKDANITDKENPSLKQEYELRQKINDIIKEQKKHLRESLKEQQKQRDLALKTIDDYKKAPTSESLSSTKNTESNNSVITDTKKSSKEIKELKKTIKEQEAVIADLNKNGRNSEYFTKLGSVDKSTQTFKKNTAEVTKMLARYKELAAMDKRTKTQNAEKNKLNGQLTQILVAQKKQATEILEKNKQDLAVLQNKQGTTEKTVKKSASTKKATNKGVSDTTSVTTSSSSDRLGQLVEITNKILAEIKSPKSTAKTKNVTKNTSEKTDTTPVNKQSNKKVLSLSQRLGKVTAQRDALPEGSAERAAIEERIKLIRKEIVEKQKSAKVDKSLMLSAFNLGQEEQKVSNKISQGRKEDTNAVKQEINATKELVSLYQRLGQLDEEISSKDGYEKISFEDERDKVQSQINAKQFATTEAEIEAYVKAREDARIKINKQLAKKEDSAELKEEISNIRELTNAYSKLGKLQANLDNTTGARSRKELEDQIEKQKLLIQEKQRGINVDEDLLDAQRVIAYNKQVDKLRLSEAKRFDKAEEAARKDAFKNVYGLQEVEKATKTKDNIKGITLSDEFKNSNIIQNELTNINNAYDKLINKQKQFKDANPAQSEIEEFKMLENQYDQAVLKLEKIIKSSRSLAEQAREGKISSVNPEEISNVDKLKERLISTAMAFDGTGIKVENFDADLKQLDYSVKQQDGTWKNFSVQLNSAGTQIVGLAGKTKNVESIFKSFFSGSLDKFKNAIQVFSGYNLFFEGISKIRQGIQYVKEIDSALTELKKVTDETDESYAQFLQTMSKTGSEIGATVSDLTNMAASWARLGYSMQEAGDLARSTAVLLNVSEFTDAEKASEALISTIQAYGYAAEDSMHVVDVLNEIGKILPVDNYNG